MSETEVSAVTTDQSSDVAVKTREIEEDLERLDALLRDLEARAFRPSQIPYQGMQELGKFIEEVHEALGACLGFNFNEIKIDGWHNQLIDHGYPCHSARYGALHEIYGYRNISSHPNEDMHSITLSLVQRRFADICELLPDLVRRITSHLFVDHLFERQACSLPQLRADALRAAIEASGSADLYIPVISEYALPFIPERKRAFLAAPIDRQLKSFVVQLGRQCTTASDDLLHGLARHLLGDPPAGLDLRPIRAWTARYGDPSRPGSAASRLPVIRATLDRDPRSTEGFLIRYATIIEPIVPGLIDHLPNFPIAVAQLGHLYEQMVTLLTRLRIGCDRAVTGRAMGTIRHWQEFILELEVPADLSAINFERASDGRPGRNLAGLFRCTTLRPTFDYDTVPPLRGLDRPIAHPRHRSNSVAIWETNDVEQLFRARRGRDCLFTGPSAWTSFPGVPPIVQAFEDLPGAIVCSADDDCAGVDPLFQGQDHCDWAELLDRVTDLRLSEANLKVLWNDPSYESPLAESL